jgi:type IV fimbrial biogenesis protein FimT
MIRSPQMPHEAKALNRRHPASRGFSMIELVFVLLIGLVLTSMAVPVVQSSYRYFQLRSAVSAVTGAIQSTRYQAIFHGCTYSIAFSKANYNYTISSWAPAAGGAACLAAPVVGTPIPLPGSSSNITLNADATFTLGASGLVTPAGGNAAAGIILTQAKIAAPETITVSNYGKTTVTP